MGETDLDALLIALEELKPHVDPCDCGDCKPITDAAAAIRRLRKLKITVERCSFCGGTSRRTFISGASCYICNECVVLCSDIFREIAAPTALVPPHGP